MPQKRHHFFNTPIQYNVISTTVSVYKSCELNIFWINNEKLVLILFKTFIADARLNPLNEAGQKSFHKVCLSVKENKIVPL